MISANSTVGHWDMRAHKELPRCSPGDYSGDTIRIAYSLLRVLHTQFLTGDPMPVTLSSCQE